MPFKSIKARQIFDSRGNPTVEVDLVTDLGLFRAAVPSGASTGVHEALEMRDEVKADWLGKGVLKAVENINKTIGPAVLASGLCVTQQKDVSAINRLFDLFSLLVVLLDAMGRCYFYIGFIPAR